MPDLFKSAEDAAIAATAPLAVRMRPRTVDEILGQNDFLGEGKMLRRMLQANRLTSLIFHGPPGSGKTTLAHVIACQFDCEFHILNAASCSVKDVREIIDGARALLASTRKRTVLFIDELHRFNRAQQDVLLNDVENGTIILIGATTENPFFAINSPLLSRSTVFQFSPLTEADIVALLRRAIADKERGLGNLNIQATDEALEHLARICDGDARRALTALEVGILSQRGKESGVGPSARGVGAPPASSEELQKRCRGYLPHWTKEGATYAVTFRLADSLPNRVLEAWQGEREEILDRIRQQNRQPTTTERKELHHLFSARVDAFLDAGQGECHLRDPRVATVVQDTMRLFDDERYRLIAWCIMPNHVHAILQPLPGHELPKIMHSWKSFTAKEANKILAREGAFWQGEYYDHLIRDEEDFGHCLQYIIDNPEKAGLKDWPYRGVQKQKLSIEETDNAGEAPAILADKVSAPRKPAILFDLTVAQESIQAKALQYDAAGDQHYDAISAFIKSMRGSDPDATVYWLARMLVAGEDPRFIARRIAILASEDIGNADPRAITVAASAFDIVEKIGLPECQLTLAQAAIYMATAPKSNASYMAINAATDDVKNNRTVPVPKHLRNAPHSGMAQQYGYGKGYQYSHSFAGGVSPDQDYLGVDKQYYTPTDRGYEKTIRAYLEWVEKLKGTGDQGTGTRE